MNLQVQICLFRHISSTKATRRRSNFSADWARVHLVVFFPSHPNKIRCFIDYGVKVYYVILAPLSAPLMPRAYFVSLFFAPFGKFSWTSVSLLFCSKDKFNALFVLSHVSFHHWTVGLLSAKWSKIFFNSFCLAFHSKNNKCLGSKKEWKKITKNNLF